MTCCIFQKKKNVCHCYARHQRVLLCISKTMKIGCLNQQLFHSHTQRSPMSQSEQPKHICSSCRTFLLKIFLPLNHLLPLSLQIQWQWQKFVHGKFPYNISSIHHTWDNSTKIDATPATSFSSSSSWPSASSSFSTSPSSSSTSSKREAIL